MLGKCERKEGAGWGIRAGGGRKRQESRRWKEEAGGQEVTGRGRWAGGQDGAGGKEEEEVEGRGSWRGY